MISGQIAFARAVLAVSDASLSINLVGSDNHVEEIVKSEWCDNVQATIGFQTYTQGMNDGRIPRQGFVGTT